MLRGSHVLVSFSHRFRKQSWHVLRQRDLRTAHFSYVSCNRLWSKSTRAIPHISCILCMLPLQTNIQHKTVFQNIYSPEIEANQFNIQKWLYLDHNQKFGYYKTKFCCVQYFFCERKSSYSLTWVTVIALILDLSNLVKPAWRTSSCLHSPSLVASSQHRKVLVERKY